MPQFNVRLSDELWRIIDEIAERHRTTKSEIVRAYVEYLQHGGALIGYPGVQPLPPKEEK
jgi:Arc/MetJ-type ribon-helix-helix transcriptional regulator